LGRLDPHLVPGRFVFVSLREVPPQVDPVAMVVEPEGRSLVLPVDVADSLGLGYDFVAAMITLQVHSALDDVGLTAAVSTALARAGIACNVIAGYHHDHLFVPHARAQEALAIVRGLA
jgi:hypothetical protein